MDKEYNKQHFDNTWEGTALISHKIWPQWAMISERIDGKSKILEIGPGTRPRIPVRGSYFVELSGIARRILKDNGGNAKKSMAGLMKNHFDMVCAFEVLEHVQNDEELVSEIRRCLRKNGLFFLSVPTNQKLYNKFDKFAGHYRRYDPSVLEALLEKYGFRIELYAEDILGGGYTREPWATMAIALYRIFPNLAKQADLLANLLACQYAKLRPYKWKTGPFAIGKKCNGVLVLCRKTPYRNTLPS